MKKEIAAVVFFLKRLIKQAGTLEADKFEPLVERLTVALQEKFRGHWYPHNPSKGQAFRCIRVNRFTRQDPELLRACRECGVQYRDLGLPQELTLWVDPGEVCCRYGEKNQAFTVASFSGDDDDKEDVTKKVTSAVERVTSDYHSGSSSDEESSFRDIRPAPPLSQSRHTHQMNPAAPTWHPAPKKKMGPGKGFHSPHPQYGFRPPGRLTQPFRQHGGSQHGHRAGRFWGSIPNLAHC